MFLAARVLMLLLLFYNLAYGQSSGGFTPGQILGATQLNSAFALKQDYPVPASAFSSVFSTPNTWIALQAFIGGLTVPTLTCADNSTSAASTAFALACGGGNSGFTASPAALAATVIPAPQTNITVLAMAASGTSTCSLRFAKGTSTPTSVYGEVLNSPSGIYWEPQYSTNPMLACEWGTIADGTINATTNVVTGTDNTVIIQTAINYALQNNWNAVCLNDGKYKTTDTLHLGWGDSFYSINLTSCNNGRNSGTGLSTGAILYSTATDRCAINIQGGRNIGIKGISLFGQNYSWVFNGMPVSPWPTTAAGWLNSAITPTGTNPGGIQRYAPYGGICEDAYSGAPPSTLGSFAQYPFVTNYPAFTELGTTAASISSASPAVVNWGTTANHWLNSNCNASFCPIIFTAGSLPAGFSLNTLYYVKTFLSGNTFTVSATPGGSAINNAGAAATGLTASRQFDMNLSSNSSIVDSDIEGFAVNINWDSSATNGQGDYLLVDRVILSNCVYCISIGNDQSRNVAIRDIQYAFCYAGLTNQRFGQGAGKLGGPIDNMSGGECYEAFDIGALSFGFPLSINDFYSEGLIRFGSFAGGSDPNTIIINGCDVSFGQGFGTQSTLPVAYIESNSGKISFSMNSCAFSNGPGRIDALVHGVAAVTISGGLLAIGQIALPVINLPGIPVAYNYTGGVLVSGTTSAYPSNSAGALKWINPTSTLFMSNQTTVVAAQNIQTNADFASWGNRAVYTQATRGFFDLLLKRWQEFSIAPPVGNVQLASGAYTGTTAAISSCDVLTFTLLNAYQAANSQPTNMNTGDILYYTVDGTIFVVTQVGATSGGAYPITAKQMNNMVVNVSDGSCVTNNISDPTLAGNTSIIHTAGTNYANVSPIGAGTPDNIRIPIIQFFGDFAAGNTSVQNISFAGPTSAATTFDTYVKNGDIVWGYFGANDPTLNWPYAIGTILSGVTNGTPGSATLSPASILSGRYPILPLPVVGLGIQTNDISRLPTASASGGTCAVNATPTAGNQVRGTIALTGVCVATNTITLTFAINGTTGWDCSLKDRTAAAILIPQTSSTATSATFTVQGTTGATDVLGYGECAPY